MADYNRLAEIEVEIQKNIQAGNLNSDEMRSLFVERAKINAVIAYEAQKKLDAIEEIPVVVKRGRKRKNTIQKILNDIETLKKSQPCGRPDVVTSYLIGEKLNDLKTFRKLCVAYDNLHLSRRVGPQLLKFYNNTTRKGLDTILEHAKNKDVPLYLNFFIAMTEGNFRNQREYTNFAISCINNKNTSAMKVHDAIRSNASQCTSQTEKACVLANDIRTKLGCLVESAIEMGIISDAQ